MSTDVQQPSGQSDTNPPAEPAGSHGFGQGPDAGLYLIGVIAVMAFISMIAVLFWVASRESSEPVAAVPISTTPPPESEEGVVLLPMVSGKSTRESQNGLTGATPTTQESTPPPATGSPPVVTNGGNAPLQSTVPTSASQPGSPPIGSQPSGNATASPTLGTTRTQTVTPTTSNQTAIPTLTGEVTTLFIRNDQGCVDPRNYDLYIFGEIVNNGTAPVDILNWDVTIYDNGREIQTDDIFLDIPNNYAVFANSSIPFALLTTLDRPTFTDYDISLDYAAGPHTPRNDLSIVEYTSTRDAGFTEVTGTWSHTDVENPPEIVWIIATAHDAQGKVTNLQYQHYTNASVIDPRLPSGQHSFRQLYLEDNPCGGGTVAVSVLGE